MRIRIEVLPGAFRAVYDGSCDICGRFALRLKREAGVRVFLVACDAAEREAFVPEVAKETCEKAFVVVTPQGDVLSGADAVLALSDIAPSIRRWAWIARLPGGMSLARSAYAFVARHRRRCPGCGAAAAA